TVAGAPVGLLWANQATPLAEPVLFAAADFPIGMAVQTGRIKDGDPFQTGLVRHFNSVTCENEMKPGLIHPQVNTYDWGPADSTVTFAQNLGMSVHGHVLVWHEQIPSWMSNFSGSTAEWEAMLRSHIQAVVGHYKGKVSSWDVVNEAFLDDGSPRSTIWQQNIPDYIAKAFTWAHEADPAAKLFYNDYNMEGLPAKRVAVLAAIADLKTRGIPVDGIGFQAHVNLDWPTSADFKAAVSAAAAMNLLIRFSELDVSVNPNNTQSQLTDSLRIQQRARYKEIAEAYLTAPSALRQGITLWGLRDPDSWILYVFNRQDWPCLFDDAYRAKPAFYGFWEGLMP
ncbi:MAG: endo-1,4-beta-xylanase, partial [Acidobacteria bacterium]|nr:endo-1,4-beta-xylanase [Acidobacteriota bacterium]